MDIYATESMGAKIYDVTGHYVGRVREFIIEPAAAPNRVSHYLLSRGHFQPLVAKHNQVASVAAGRMELSVSERALELYQPNESWLAVQKDLLDQQIIDTRGRKVVRVNDVELTPFRTNGNVELRLAQVDVGIPGAVRRLLQGVVPSKVVRKLQSKLRQLAIRWEFVNLVEADPREEMARDAAADLLADLSKETSEELLDEMPGQEADEVRELLEFDPATAGGMMSPDFVFVGESSMREEVLEWIRGQEINLDQLDTIVLLDGSAQFSGTVPVARLLLAAADQRMTELKMEPLLSLAPNADDKEVFELFDKYNLRMLTVVDKENRPIRAITVDDVVSKLVKQ